MELERRLVTDKATLHSEMAQRVQDAAKVFQAETNAQLAVTSRRALIENVAISSEMSKLSSETARLLMQQEELSGRLKEREYVP